MENKTLISSHEEVMTQQLGNRIVESAYWNWNYPGIIFVLKISVAEGMTNQADSKLGTCYNLSHSSE